MVHFTKLECIHKSGENSNHDEVYLRVYTYSDPNDPSKYETKEYFKDSPLCMNGNDDSMRYVDITIKGAGLHRVSLELIEKDKNSSDESLGTLNITRDIATVTSAEHVSDVYQTTGGAHAHYWVYWRIIQKPLPSLRILGIFCQKGSSGCDADQIKRVAEVKSQAASAASDVFGHIKTPKAELLSDAFLAASYEVKVQAAVEVWLNNVKEGDDDVYLQHVAANQGDDAGGAFWPEKGSHIKMNDGKQFSFVETQGHYYRFPLDLGPVTIQVRERDTFGRDVSLGAMTIGDAEYSALKDKGAQVMVLTDFLNDRNKGEGAIYHLAYSVGQEDFAKDATPAAQGYAT